MFVYFLCQNETDVKSDGILFFTAGACVRVSMSVVCGCVRVCERVIEYWFIMKITVLLLLLTGKLRL